MEKITNDPQIPSQIVEKIEFPQYISNLGIIPTSYKDSMDYYETLAWLCKYVEEVVIPTLNQNGNAVKELQELYTQLQTYVVNYFTNLDVQTEINNKLDKMVADGTFGQILEPLVTQEVTKQLEGFKTEINQEVDTKISQLETNVNQELNNQDQEVQNKLNEQDTKINESITNINNTITDFEIKYGKLVNERVIMIGDSYGVGILPTGTTTGWCDRLKELMNLSNDNYFKLVENAIGFLHVGTENHTFLSLLQDNINNITNKNTITKVILCGGHNDYDQPFIQLKNAISNFVDYCKEQFPNAKILLGMVGSNGQLSELGTTRRVNINNIVLPAYKSCIDSQAQYLEGVETILKDYSLLSSDGVHPTNEGYQILTNGIYQAIIQGSYYRYTDERNATLTYSENILAAINYNLPVAIPFFSIKQKLCGSTVHTTIGGIIKTSSKNNPFPGKIGGVYKLCDKVDFPFYRNTNQGIYLQIPGENYQRRVSFMVNCFIEFFTTDTTRKTTGGNVIFFTDDNNALYMFMPFISNTPPNYPSFESFSNVYHMTFETNSFTTDVSSC